MRRRIDGRILRNFFLIVVVALGAAVASYFIYPGMWRGLAFKLLLDRQIPPAKTSHEAALSGHETLNKIRTAAVGKWELKEMEINSMIDEQMRARQQEANGHADPADIASVLANGLKDLQVKIEDNSVTIGANLDLKTLAPYIKQTSGKDLPEEFQRQTALEAKTRVSVDNRVLTINFETITLGKVSLKNSVLSGMMSDLTEQLETYLRQTVKSQIPGEFKEVNTEQMSYRLPDNIENVEVVPEKIIITYKDLTGQSGAAP